MVTQSNIMPNNMLCLLILESRGTHKVFMPRPGILLRISNFTNFIGTLLCTIQIHTVLNIPILTAGVPSNKKSSNTVTDVAISLFIQVTFRPEQKSNSCLEGSLCLEFSPTESAELVLFGLSHIGLQWAFCNGLWLLGEVPMGIKQIVCTSVKAKFPRGLL